MVVDGFMVTSALGQRWRDWAGSPLITCHYLVSPVIILSHLHVITSAAWHSHTWSWPEVLVFIASDFSLCCFLSGRRQVDATPTLTWCYFGNIIREQGMMGEEKLPADHHHYLLCTCTCKQTSFNTTEFGHNASARTWTMFAQGEILKTIFFSWNLRLGADLGVRVLSKCESWGKINGRFMLHSDDRRHALTPSLEWRKVQKAVNYNTS